MWKVIIFEGNLKNDVQIELSVIKEIRCNEDDSKMQFDATKMHRRCNSMQRRAERVRFIRFSWAAINLENSIYFANLEPNVGRTRDEINLRSFLGIKSGVSAKFGAQPADSSAAKYTYRWAPTYTRTREHGIMRYLIWVSRRYISAGVDGMACSLDFRFSTGVHRRFTVISIANLSKRVSIFIHIFHPPFRLLSIFFISNVMISPFHGYLAKEIAPISTSLNRTN